MPAHLHKRRGRKIWEIVEGRKRKSTGTENRAYAEELLDRFMRDKFAILKPGPAKGDIKRLFKEYGTPDSVMTMRRLRFPCVYAFVRGSEILYVGCSVAGFGRVLHSRHPMADLFSDLDEIYFWVMDTVADVRFVEMSMIRKFRPRFNDPLRRYEHMKRKKWRSPDMTTHPSQLAPVEIPDVVEIPKENGQMVPEGVGPSLPT